MGERFKTVEEELDFVLGDGPVDEDIDFGFSDDESTDDLPPKCSHPPAEDVVSLRQGASKRGDCLLGNAAPPTPSATVCKTDEVRPSGNFRPGTICNHGSWAQYKQTSGHGSCIEHATVCMPFSTGPSRRRPQKSRFCKHPTCNRYIQTGCRGYCCTHAKVYHPRAPTPTTGPPTARAGGAAMDSMVYFGRPAEEVAVPTASKAASGFTMATLASSAAKDPAWWKSPLFAEQAAAPAFPGTAIDPTLATLVLAASEDPTLWKCPIFAKTMKAVASQVTAMSQK